MSRKSQPTFNDLCSGLAIFVGLSLLSLVIWLLALLAIASLVFLGLTALTNWDLNIRIGTSVALAFVTLKLLGLLSATLDLIPETWRRGKNKSKPCPECGETLRSALAQQCIRCGADWHT